MNEQLKRRIQYLKTIIETHQELADMYIDKEDREYHLGVVADLQQKLRKIVKALDRFWPPIVIRNGE